MTVRVAAIQLSSTTDPAANADTAVRLVREAIAGGAKYVQTPEITNLCQSDRDEAARLIVAEGQDGTLNAMRALAAGAGVLIHIGSIVVREGDLWRNRSVLIGTDGEVIARYDKMHMFDADLGEGESVRESEAYAAGDEVVLADLGEMRLGMTICFDLRFPRLYEELSVAGANVLAVPSAFAVETGAQHWHVLLRSRAIENGAFVIAAAQEGEHEDGRTTYGHSLIVSPHGEVLAEARETPGVIFAELDLSQCEEARSRVPLLSARKPFEVRIASRSEHRRAS